MLDGGLLAVYKIMEKHKNGIKIKEEICFIDIY